MSQRQIILDTETTGLDPTQGHRVIEIGCLELLNRRPTDQRFHVYLQPDRTIDEDAIRVHGITNEFLADQPRFADIADEFLNFVRDAELIIHNAPFDLGFLNHELRRCGRGHLTLEQICKVKDTLLLARQRHPGQRNSLDALCKRYNVDNTQRTLHGALLDAEILADVYLAMTRQQSSMFVREVAGAAARPISPHGDRRGATARRCRSFAPTPGKAPNTPAIWRCSIKAAAGRACGGGWKRLKPDNIPDTRRRNGRRLLQWASPADSRHPESAPQRRHRYPAHHPVASATDS